MYFSKCSKEIEKAAEIEYLDDMLAESIAESLNLLPDKPQVWMELYGRIGHVNRSTLKWLVGDYKRCKMEARDLIL